MMTWTTHHQTPQRSTTQHSRSWRCATDAILFGHREYTGGSPVGHPRCTRADYDQEAVDGSTSCARDTSHRQVENSLEAAIAFPWCVRCECGYFVIRTASHGAQQKMGGEQSPRGSLEDNLERATSTQRWEQRNSSDVAMSRRSVLENLRRRIQQFSRNLV